MKKSIGGRLKDARQASGLTQQQVAATLKRTRQTVSCWERGEALPSVLEFRELALLYTASCDWILLGIKTAPTGGRLLDDIFRERRAADTPA